MKQKAIQNFGGPTKCIMGELCKLRITSVWNSDVAPEKDKVKDSSPEKPLADCKQG